MLSTTNENGLKPCVGSLTVQNVYHLVPVLESVSFDERGFVEMTPLTGKLHTFKNYLFEQKGRKAGRKVFAYITRSLKLYSSKWRY